MKRKKKKTAQVLAEDLNPVETALGRFQGLLSSADYKLLLAELEQPLRQAIRVNRLKCDPESALPIWAERYGWQTEKVPYCDTGWWVNSGENSLAMPVEHRMGFYYIQDAASMLPVSLFKIDPQQEMLVLDMAASPGGKTTHLIDRLGDSGLVIANDSSRERITALRLILQSWGGINTGVTNFPGEKFGKWFPEVFDRILLDAPCSMQNLRSTESRPMRSITDRERDALSVRQKRLLESAFQALKTGGQIVYATCTLNPEEDEVVLDHLRRLYPDSLQIEELSSHLSVPAPGLKNTLLDGQQVIFDDQVKNAARFWPHLYGTSGFFSALITKTKPLNTARKFFPGRDWQVTGLTQLHGREESDLLDQLYQLYGFDFGPVLEAQKAGIFRREEVFYVIPDLWLKHFSELSFQAVGMRLGERSPAGFVPSHEWVTRFGQAFQDGFIRLTLEQIEPWMAGEDLEIEFSEEKKGQIVLVKDDLERIYGRGRIQSRRLKNLFPYRLIYN